MLDKYIGQQIGIFKILELSDKKDNNGHKLYKGQCIFCGEIITGRIIHIQKTVNCTHKYITWQCGTKLQSVFKNMRNRCYNSSNKDYRFYGAKGIKICQEWLNNPLSFRDWALENGYQENLTIDRIDSSKDYYPENCRWITAKENTRFKSTTNYIEVNGITMSGRQWSEELNKGINFINRMNRQKGKEFTLKYIKQELNNMHQ